MWKYNHSPPLNEFYHHGVKGMKWGVINEDHSSPRKSKAGDAVVYGSAKSKAIRALLLLSNLIVPGMGFAISGSAELRAQIKAGKERTDALLEEKFELKKKEQEVSPEKDIKAINPKYTGLDGAYNNNCSNCTAAYELRRRGFDVTAKGLFGGRRSDEIDSIFGNPKKQHVSVPDDKNFSRRGKAAREALMVDLGKQPKGARGAIKVGFKDTGMSHIFNWENGTDGPKLIDAQNYGSKPDRLFKHVVPESIEYFRTDNAKINMLLIHDSVKNR